MSDTEISAVAVAAAIVVVTVVAVWIWKGLNLAWLSPKKNEAYLKRQGLSGTPFTFLVGDVRREASMVEQAKSKPISLTDDNTQRVMPLILQTVKDHGKTTYMWMGPKARVIVTKPEHIKEVFNRVYDFPKPPIHPIVELFATGVAMCDGEKWAKHRKIINPPFHLEKLKVMIPAFYERCSEMISKWEIMVSEKGSLSEIDIWPYLGDLTSDVISRTAFGSSYEEGKRIFELQEEQGRRLLKALELGFIPGMRFLPTKNNMRMWQINREVKSRLKEIIMKRQRAMEAREAPKNDLLGILLESNSGDHGMSIDDVVEECRLFHFAGQETTAVLLVWTMIMLSHYKQWQEQAREEILEVIGKNNKPNFDALSRLKIMSMILNEVLRLYPPGILLGRAIEKETKLGEDMTLPGGAEVVVPVLMVHRDPELWGEDVHEFKPERFADGISKATKNQVSFLPFGWGPRFCPGQTFALMEAKMALVLILQRFSFELSPSYTHAPHTVLTLHPQFGAPLIFHML
ncbi:PREDICTED: cytochrome P450 72A13-like [Camelina sativa]|uniref:Cytochrome P450 72A13-like n=1 Tax=Camelina sativa TaxID=90675 RepID=A0ABM0W3Z5_CAMSA|nr:PREDICTED: cytochrome P450 72A13-like [Camelina sativa]